MLHRRTALSLIAAALCPAALAATAGARKKTSRAAKQTPPRDYGEQPQDRDRRLARECRNQRNAGACAGFGYGS